MGDEIQTGRHSALCQRPIATKITPLVAHECEALSLNFQENPFHGSGDTKI